MIQYRFREFIGRAFCRTIQQRRREFELDAMG